ncbi:FACT complex subunit SSRP1-A [Porphyridium purpureum]|uniref:FACT complex subunit SSRP1 n=1 Tax=Porphyridium purpureum TaxID=35688 RepID=A0A5J4YMW4_PORPP|nr:FACT complex subunit SSRP1-A [Porphyridium purpureum]|eukprot:POR0041..scf295_9
MEDTLQFAGVLLAGLGVGEGTLKIASSGLAWRGREGARVLTVNKADLQQLVWLRGGRAQQLRCVCRGQISHRFEGFKESDFASIEAFVQKHALIGAAPKDGQHLTRLKQASRGWSWGTASVSGGALYFHNDKLEEVFEISLSSVAQVNLSGANELGLEFHTDDTAGAMDECMTELRLAIAEEAEAESLAEAIRDKADTSAFAGERLASFSEISLLVPRGKYEVELFPNYFKLHGRSVDYKILYSSVTKLFLLPKPDEIHVSFVVSLDPPIRQGNTMYPHLVFNFKADEEVSVQFNISAEELAQKYEKLKPTEEGELWRVFSKSVRHLSGKPLHIPRSFTSVHEQRAVRTALGANEGYIFFLESCMFFLNKPPTLIRFDDVELVQFKRMDNSRSFDLSVTLTSAQVFLFSNIDRAEFDNIHEFLKSHKVPMASIAAHVKKLSSGRGSAAVDMEVDGGDDDDEGSEESEDEDFDVKAAAKKGGKKGGNKKDSGSEASDASSSDMDDDELDAEFEEAAESEDERPKKKKK